MYFVTVNRKGYILFCTTPSERAALGLTEERLVHLLVRASPGAPWETLTQWKDADYSHTDFMAALHHADEPADPKRLLDFLPSGLRGQALH